MNGGDVQVVKVGGVEDVGEVVFLAVASSEPQIPLSILSLILCLKLTDQQKSENGLFEGVHFSLSNHAGNHAMCTE